MGSEMCIRDRATADTDARIKELEEQIQRSEKKLETAAHENDKLKNVLGRYRDRWEKLKEGAKTRRAEGRSGDSQSNPPASGASKPSETSSSPDPGQGSSAGHAASRAAGDSPA